MNSSINKLIQTKEQTACPFAAHQVKHGALAQVISNQFSFPCNELIHDNKKTVTTTGGCYWAQDQVCRSNYSPSNMGEQAIGGRHLLMACRQNSEIVTGKVRGRVQARGSRVKSVIKQFTLLAAHPSSAHSLVTVS